MIPVVNARRDHRSSGSFVPRLLFCSFLSFAQLLLSLFLCGICSTAGSVLTCYTLLVLSTSFSFLFPFPSLLLFLVRSPVPVPFYCGALFSG